MGVSWAAGAPPNLSVYHLGSIDTHPSTYVVCIHAWACPRLSPRGEYFFTQKLITGDLRYKLYELLKIG